MHVKLPSGCQEAGADLHSAFHAAPFALVRRAEASFADLIPKVHLYESRGSPLGLVIQCLNPHMPNQ